MATLLFVIMTFIVTLLTFLIGGNIIGRICKFYKKVNTKISFKIVKKREDNTKDKSKFRFIIDIIVNNIKYKKGVIVEFIMNNGRELSFGDISARDNTIRLIPDVKKERMESYSLLHGGIIIGERIEKIKVYENTKGKIRLDFNENKAIKRINKIVKKAENNPNK